MSTSTTPDLPPLHLCQKLGQRRDVENILEALAIRLEHDRELRILAGDLEERGAPLALLPQGRPAIGAPARQQQRPGRAFAEAAREQRRRSETVDHQVLDLVGLEQDRVGRRCLVGLGQTHDDAVVRVHRLDLEPEPLADPRLDRLRPRRVHLRTEGRVDADAPVAELVAKALDHDRAVVGQHAGGLALLVEIARRCSWRPARPGRRARSRRDRAAGRHALELAHEAAEGAAELDRTARRVAVPERHASRGRRAPASPGRGRG